MPSQSLSAATKPSVAAMSPGVFHHRARVFIGWDGREADAFDVCGHSIRRRSTMGILVQGVYQKQLRQAGMYWRPQRKSETSPQMIDVLSDTPVSTEFAFTRFLVPLICGYEGWALFCDCDFLFQSDISSLWGLKDDRYAVMCVKHDHVPTEDVKMDGVMQTRYPRKNWSSLMLFNCAHPAMRRLTTKAVSSASPAWLHRMAWCKDDEIGSLPETWNWLAGVSPTTAPYIGMIAAEGVVKPDAIHYTAQAPWFPHQTNCPYAEQWHAERADLEEAGAA